MTFCAECGGRVHARRGEYRHRVSGVDVVLANVFVERCEKCEIEEVVIPALERLHASIAGALLRLGELEGPMIRFLRKSKGWSQDDFAREMKVDVEVVDQWERGERDLGDREREFRCLMAVSKPIEDYGEHNGRTMPPRVLAKASALKFQLVDTSRPEWRPEPTAACG